MTQNLVHDPVFGQRIGFRHSTDPDGSEVLHVDVWVDPGGGVTPHIHPGMEERFTVVAGSPSFLAGRKWQTPSPGETVVVPPGVRHAYRNRSDKEAHFTVEVRPPSTLQEMLEDASAMSRAGKITKQAMPTSFGALVEMAMLAERHREMVKLTFPPAPPQFVQRLLFPLLARFGERRGYRVGRLANG